MPTNLTILYWCLWKNTPPQNNAHWNASFQSTKSGAGEHQRVVDSDDQMMREIRIPGTAAYCLQWDLGCRLRVCSAYSSTWRGSGSCAGYLVSGCFSGLWFGMRQPLYCMYVAFSGTSLVLLFRHWYATAFVMYRRPAPAAGRGLLYYTTITTISNTLIYGNWIRTSPYPSY